MAESSLDDDSGLLPEALIWEILTWVPVKSLMRFKCVSGLWLSIILNPLFARVYRGGFKGLLLSKPYYSGLASNHDFFYLTQEEGDDGDGDKAPKQIFHHHTVDHLKKMESTAPVNGLVCFYYGNCSYLYNVATRESKVLPVSIWNSGSCTYHLGFDPSNQMYKLLKTCPVYERYDDEDHLGYGFLRNLNSEILTIGVDSSWRCMESAPWEIDSRSVCLNGVLYWTNPSGFGSRRKTHLLSFDVAREKFQFIPQPERGTSSMLWFGNCLAVTSLCLLDEDEWVFILCYDDNIGKGNGGECGGSSLSTGLWREHTAVKLPKYEYTNAVGMLPNGKVLGLSWVVTGWKFPIPFFLYDLTKGELHESYIWDCPSSTFRRLVVEGGDFVYVSYQEENIIPLGCVGCLI